MAPWSENDREYCRHLAGERHMFAWCLQKYGGLAPPEAEAEALRFYPYEPPSDPHRGLSFHDHAWHWAMLKIHGPHYWVKDRGLESPPDDYRVESERFDRTEPATS